MSGLMVVVLLVVRFMRCIARQGFFLFYAVCLLWPLQLTADLLTDRHIDDLVALAKDGKNNKFVSYLHREKLLNETDKDGHTALYAAMFGEPQLTKTVLQLGAPIEQRDNLGYTPLMAASLLGYPQAAEILLDKGADIEAKNNDGQTPLLVSVLGTTANYVDLDAVKKNQWHNRWGQVTRLLLKKGADVNAADKRGATPLFLAIFSQDVELCRELIKAGANTNYQLPNGVSMLRFARTISSKQVIELLKQNGARE
jgi:ankyrin repeat protein